MRPSFFIMTFCTCTTGFVARCRDFFASLSLCRMVTACGWGREVHLGGEASSIGGLTPLQTVCAKLAKVCFTGEHASEKRCSGRVSLVPRAIVMLRMEAGEAYTGAPSVWTSKRTVSRATVWGWISSRSKTEKAIVWNPIFANFSK